jgi:alkylhydroperoxidase/carboxymuconolactone decarboxylase family protein YurZ
LASGSISKQAPDGVTIPSVVNTVEHLFGQILSRPYLTLRDRRLLTFGATSMLGRPDLLETQLRGSMENREFTVDQLREIVLHLHHYAGWPNGEHGASSLRKAHRRSFSAARLLTWAQHVRPRRRSRRMTVSYVSFFNPRRQFQYCSTSTVAKAVNHAA